MLPLVRPRHHLRAFACAGVLALAAAQASAAPEDGDALARLLQETGLVARDLPSATAESDAPPSFAQRVRSGTSNMLLTAMAYLGVPYKRGGSTEQSGFDCSGFTRHVFQASLGLVLPRRADEQASAPGFVPVSREDLKPGDLVFFNTLKRTFSHVGIYVGEGRFIHSPRAGSVVRVDNMSMAYWASRFTGARRATGGDSEAAAAIATAAAANPALANSLAASLDGSPAPTALFASATPSAADAAGAATAVATTTGIAAAATTARSAATPAAPVAESPRPPAKNAGSSAKKKKKPRKR